MSVRPVCHWWLIYPVSPRVTAETLILQGETDHMFVPGGPDEYHNNTDYQINLNQYT